MSRVRAPDAPLDRSDDRFDAGCGWSAFDDESPGAVTRLHDPDGHRIETERAMCGAPLDDVVHGERLTEKDTRHYVNSLSMTLISLT